MHYVRIEGGYALRERKKMICLNCGKKLKDAKSIERGYGPVCWGKVAGKSHEKAVSDSDIPEDIPGQMGFEDYPGVIPEK